MSEAPAKAPPAAPKAREVAAAPDARLERRDKDVNIPRERLNEFRDCIGLFMTMKSKPNLEKNPETILLRRYYPEDEVCRQGEPGNSAFYIITAEDEARLRTAGFLGPKNTQVGVTLNDETLSVHLAIPKPAARRRGLFGWRRDKAAAESKPKARFIPIDAPVGVDYESKRASLLAGELFGEMSCLSGTPRSATIIAERDCYVIEMLRNVFDQLRRDAKFKEEMDRKYRDRVFGLQVMNLPLFQDLPEHLIAVLREKAKLKGYKHGQVIFEEHDRSTDMFIVRSGVVKVCKGISSLYTRRDILWDRFVSRLAAADADSTLGIVSALMPAEVRRKPADPPAGDDGWQQEVVDALNAMIKGPDLVSLSNMPADGKTWAGADGENKRNRAWLDEKLAGLVRTLRAAAGPERILTYRSRGELVGEMGVLLNQPRSATCVAYGHQQGEESKDDVTEVVQITADIFHFLVSQPGAETFHQHVEDRVRERQSDDEARKRLSGGDAEAGKLRRVTPEFERLGLIQGQRLMLVDLDRCTRCDECVRACADVHADGRSRLFLEGPRFEHYLVPLTCRSCLNPVCLVGCPVGSIRRGKDLEIQIEDWCIGCEVCAKNCPYGSIQMHDIGVIPSAARGWRFTADAAEDPKRLKNVSRWAPGQAPFRLDAEFRESAGPGGTYWFAREFRVDADLLADSHDFEFELIGPNCMPAVYVNGKLVPTAETKYKNNSKSRAIPLPEPESYLKESTWYWPRTNVVQVRLTPPVGHEGVVFDLRLDATPKAQQLGTVKFQQKGVSERAVVCDLCTSLPGKKPACVNACPHEAAFRVDARVDFPAR